MVWVIFEQSFSGYLGFADGPKYSGKQQRNIIFLCSFSVAQLSYPNTKVVPSTSAIFLFLLFLFRHSQPERQQPGGGERHTIYQGEPHTAPGTWDIDWTGGESDYFRLEIFYVADSKLSYCGPTCLNVIFCAFAQQSNLQCRPSRKITV